MRSIMRTEGALCTLDCKQQINSSFVIWFGRKQVFFRGEIHFFNPNEPINLDSLLGPSCQHAWWRRSLKTQFFPCVLSLFFAHPFSTLANTRSASKGSLCRFSLWVCLILLSFYATTHVCFLVVHLWFGEERRRRKSGEENRFHCSALLVFCI